MIKAAVEREAFDEMYKNIFQAMVAQAQKEIERPETAALDHIAGVGKMIAEHSPRTTDKAMRALAALDAIEFDVMKDQFIMGQTTIYYLAKIQTIRTALTQPRYEGVYWPEFLSVFNKIPFLNEAEINEIFYYLTTQGFKIVREVG
jgi:hypothetical protein